MINCMQPQQQLQLLNRKNIEHYKNVINELIQQKA